MSDSPPQTPNRVRDTDFAYTPRSGAQTGSLTGAQTPATPFEWQVDTPKTRLGQTVRSSLTTLERKLNDLVTDGTSNSLAGSLARGLHARGAWVQQALREEWELRTNAVSGLDQMWILLSPPELGGPPADGAGTAFNANKVRGGRAASSRRQRGFQFVPTCTATYTFQGDEPVSYEGVKEAVERQADAFPRYKSILVNTNRRFHGAVFTLDPNWDVERHIQSVQLGAGAGQVELEAFIAEFIARPWDFRKPLWECAIVSGFHIPESGASSALVVRGHHTLADGQGFVFSQLLTTSFGPELRAKLEDGQRLLRDARRGRAKPSKLHRSLRPLDKYRTSHYDGPRVEGKEFSVTPHFPLSDVKKIQRAFSGAAPGSWLDRAAKRGGAKNKTTYRHLTLNDVLCTVVADVLAAEAASQPPSAEARRSWLQRAKRLSHLVLPSPIALFIPISIRPLQTAPTMENWSTGSIAYLPSPLLSARSGRLRDEGDTQGLYKVLHANSDALKVVKRGWWPAVFFWSIQATAHVPWLYPSQMWDFWPIRPLMRLIIELCLTSFTAVLTNVPGPPEAVELAGKRVSEWGAAPPQAGKSTLAIGVITYAGSVSVTFTADAVRGAPSEGVARRLADAFGRRWATYLRAADAVLEGEQYGGGDGSSRRLRQS